jgi:DNA-directed RNA polymerase specialized sigma24 family protein
MIKGDGDIDERSTDDVAELLMITPVAVRVRLHLARQALSTLLAFPLRMRGRIYS